ncbi:MULTISPECIES: AraC family transcriptional regulator [Brevibacillus]|jgi:ABC-type Fe3+-hydroxamate transport system, periplasmic component|uniref:AraC family transcriptional regulator n=1 Tax=Brevibacillus TaxID=55080 RepID=UPI00156A86BA|nr:MULTISPECIES: AraC family transcriptional regulator [Brevibacillus]MBU8712416.1 helix-turn-helix domain-containing protein [Brevibacillus parabrevis]MED2257242.1 AraC family transcriptional regulator [Brevibacillus parabrevis]NRQ52514.1 AraC family transcriptional regulator [Brevibacillus sp. HD1.4A]UED71705.1 AraC family transcriptional regulator [Brevibacillus sp. HD3.3A]
MGNASDENTRNQFPLFVLEEVEKVCVLAKDTRRFRAESSFSFMAVADGQGKLWLQENAEQIAKGACWMVEPATFCEIANTGQKELRLYRLLFRTVERSKGNKGGETFRFRFDHVFNMKPAHRVLVDCQALLRRWPAEDDIEQFKMQIAFQQLLCFLLEQTRTVDAEENSAAAIERSIAYLHDHYADELTVQQLAKQANLGVRQYTRLFKRTTGKSPIDYLTTYRINRSKEELLIGGELLHTISRNSGFKDTHYFNRRFKQIVGLPPKQYACSRGCDTKIVTPHYVGDMLALGVKPIGALDISLDSLREIASSIKSIGDNQVELARIEPLQPDLIVASDFMVSSEFSVISRLAPVIVVPWDERPFERLQRIARVLGKEAEANQWLERYELKKKVVQKRVRPLVAPEITAAVLRIDNGKVWLHAPRFFPTVYEVLGFSAPSLLVNHVQQDEHIRRVPIDFARFADLQADKLIVIRGREQQFQEWFDELQRTKGWKNHEAVRRGQVHVLEHRWASYEAITLEWQLDQVDRLLSHLPTTGVGRSCSIVKSS